MSRHNQEIPTGRLERFVKLSALSTQITASTLGQRVRGLFQGEEDRARSMLEAQKKNAERMVETMGHLKGAIMKVGQMISLHDGDGMPQEVSELLVRLQSQAPPLSYARIEEVFRGQFGKAPGDLFAHFEQTPFASASLGQVHKARTLDGQNVAVKIQYPGIAETVTADLKNLRGMIEATGIVSKRFGSEQLFQEIRSRLQEEVDYVQEAINLETFRTFFKDDPRVVIPRYLPAFSSERVLTMELIEGWSTQELLDAQLSQEERNRWARDILDIFLRQILHFDQIHADPHHGNYLFLADGRIALLDFGCVKRLPPGFTKHYRTLTYAVLQHDRRTMVTELVELGFLADDSNERANDLLCDITTVFLTPFLEDRPYSFGRAELHRSFTDLPRRFLALGKMSFPPDALYLNRVFIGLYFLLRKLDVTDNWHQIMMSHLRQMA